MAEKGVEEQVLAMERLRRNEGTDFEDCSGAFCTERLLRNIYE